MSHRPLSHQQLTTALVTELGPVVDLELVLAQVLELTESANGELRVVLVLTAAITKPPVTRTRGAAPLMSRGEEPKSHPMRLVGRPEDRQLAGRAEAELEVLMDSCPKWTTMQISLQRC